MLWTEEHVGPQSMGSQRVRHDWTTNTHTNKGCISKPNSLGCGFPMKISYENMEIPLLNVDLKQMGLLMCCVKFLKAWSISRFSCVQLLVTPWAVACQLLCPWNYLGKNTGVGSHSLLQGVFPTQGLNSGLLYCRQTLYHLSHQGSPEFSLKTYKFLATIFSWPLTKGRFRRKKENVFQRPGKCLKPYLTHGSMEHSRKALEIMFLGSIESQPGDFPMICCNLASIHMPVRSNPRTGPESL